MQDTVNLLPSNPKRIPWNKGKLIGPRPPTKARLGNPNQAPDGAASARPCAIQSRD